MKVRLADAAKELGLSPLTVRGLMIEGKLNIGYALKRDGSSKWSFFIFRKLLDDEKKRLGLEV